MPRTTNLQNLPTWLEIDLDRIVTNIASIAATAGGRGRTLLTVKADAYGHGAVQVAAATMDRVDYFGVATVDEALELAESGVKTPILILSPILSSRVRTALERGFALTISSEKFADHVARCARDTGRKAEVHVEHDTGMGRTGFTTEEFESIVSHVARDPHLTLAGLYTHFPVADTDLEFTRGQLQIFLDAVQRLEKAGVPRPMLHAANSAAIAGLARSHLDLVRPGLGAYGCYDGGLGVKPAMAWKCRLVQIRRLPAGVPVSYGRTYVTGRPTTMGVLPVGYGHGYPFRLGNCGEVLVAGRRAPVIGRVTMDMSMVDLTDVDPTPQPGDEVVLIGGEGEDSITADELAERAGTISYEILTGVSKRVARVYLRDGVATTVKTLLGIRDTDAL